MERGIWAVGAAASVASLMSSQDSRLSLVSRTAAPSVLSDRWVQPFCSTMSSCVASASVQLAGKVIAGFARRSLGARTRLRGFCDRLVGEVNCFRCHALRRQAVSRTDAVQLFARRDLRAWRTHRLSSGWAQPRPEGVFTRSRWVALLFCDDVHLGVVSTWLPRTLQPGVFERHTLRWGVLFSGRRCLRGSGRLALGFAMQDIFLDWWWRFGGGCRLFGKRLARWT